MWMFPKDKSEDLHALASLVRLTVAGSRFTADVTVQKMRFHYGVKIEYVRLRNKKPYCGAHPGPCLLGRKERVMSCLEGLDWVGFNAMLNDALDAKHKNVDVFSFNREAVVRGGRYFIRRGTQRRTAYPYTYRDMFASWTQDSGAFETDFADYCGKKAPPDFKGLEIDGTPGYPCYTLAEEEKYRAEEEPEHRPVRRRSVRKLAAASEGVEA